MAVAGIRSHLARHPFIWTLAGASVLGVIAGAFYSLQLDARGALRIREPAYVQRVPIAPVDLESDAFLAEDELNSRSRNAVELDSSLAQAMDENALIESEEGQLESDAPGYITLSDGKRVLNVDFDLSMPDVSANDLRVAKAVELNGNSLGMINVTIDPNSRLHLSSEDLSTILPDELFARVDTGEDYILFDDLRAGGLEISYDPLDDILKIDS